MPFLVGVAALLVFLPVLELGFHWDDADLLLNNPYYRGLDLSRLKWMWTTTHMGHYVPLAWMSLALDHALWGLRPGGYHLTNLLLHALNAVLFCFLAARLLKPRTDEEKEILPWAAAWAALLFAVHPLRVESVAWITERRGLLSGAFCFASVLCYLRAFDGPASPRKGLAASFVFFILAALSKEIVMVLPLALLALDVYPLGRLDRADGRAFRQALWEKRWFFLVGGLAAAAGALAQIHQNIALPFGHYGLTARLAQTVHSLFFYARKTFFPDGLSPLYEVSAAPVGALWAAGGLVLAGLTAALWVLRRRWPGLLALWASYLVFLAPVSGVLQSGPQATADRYSYLSCLGWAALMGVGFLRAWKAGPASRVKRIALSLTALGVLTAMGLLTRQQLALWRSPEALWSRAVEVNPHSRVARLNLGLVLSGEGRWPEAADQFREILRVEPTDARAMYNLGVALHRLGRKKEAADYYRRTLWIDPRFGEAHNNLGRLLEEAGDLKGASDHYRRALEIYPGSEVVRQNLQRALDRGGRP